VDYDSAPTAALSFLAASASASVWRCRKTIRPIQTSRWNCACSMAGWHSPSRVRWQYAHIHFWSRNVRPLRRLNAKVVFTVLPASTLAVPHYPLSIPSAAWTSFETPNPTNFNSAHQVPSSNCMEVRNAFYGTGRFRPIDEERTSTRSRRSRYRHAMEIPKPQHP